LAFSGLVHAGAAASALLEPGTLSWAAGTILANHGLLGAAGMWPRSRLLGPNWTRLPDAAAARGEVALTFDDGPDTGVTPAVLELLDRHGAKASFFCIGERALRHPGLCRELAERGNSVENHSFRHRNSFACSGYRGFLRELAAAQEALSELAGRSPRFFRAPFGLRNPLLDPALARLDLRLASWTRRGFDTRERDPDTVLRRLVRNLAPGDILLLHDGNSARTAEGRPVVLEVLPRLLDVLAARGLKPVALPAALP
jgi:peptidoglycan/xylan/chitin deacetylase (PgdA/CDA1 family)